MNKSIERKFDEQYTSMAYGKKWRPGMEITPSMIKSFFDSTIKKAAEEIRGMKVSPDVIDLVDYKMYRNRERFNEGLEAAVKIVESLI